MKSKLKIYFLFWSNSNVRSIYELRSNWGSTALACTWTWVVVRVSRALPSLYVRTVVFFAIYWFRTIYLPLIYTLIWKKLRIKFKSTHLYLFVLEWKRGMLCWTVASMEPAPSVYIYYYRMNMCKRATKQLKCSSKFFL